MLPTDFVSVAAQLDLDVQQITPEQRLFGWFIIIAAGATVTYWLYRTGYVGLPRQLEAAKSEFRGLKADTPLQAVYLPARDATPERLHDAALTVLGEHPDEGVDVEQPSLRGAAGSLRAELAATWTPYLAGMPRLAQRAAGLGVAIAILGVVAVSTEALIQLLTADTPTTDPSAWPRLAVTETAHTLGVLSHLVTGLPVVRVVWIIGVTVLVTLWSALYAHWYLPAGALLLAAAAITRLDQRLEEDRETRWLTQLPDPAQVGRIGAAVVTMLWVLLLAGVGAGRMLGPNQGAAWYGAAAVIGGLLAVTAAGAAAVWRHRDRVTGVLERWQTASRRARWYLIVRAGTLAVAAVVGPLVPVYGIVAVTKLPALTHAFLVADTPIQATVALVGVMALWVVAWQAHAAWGDVASALRVTIARQQVRSAVIAGGVPVGVVAVTYALTASLTHSILIGLIVAIVAGVVARELLQALTRVKYRASLLGSDRVGARRIVIEGAPLEPSREAVDTQYYLRVNGSEELLHTDPDCVADAAVDAAEALLAGDDPAPSIPGWHAHFAFEDGIYDPGETRVKLHDRARKYVWHPLRQHGGMVPLEYIDDEVEDLPRDVITVESNPTHGVLAMEAWRGNLRVGDEYVEMLNDPYVR